MIAERCLRVVLEVVVDEEDIARVLGVVPFHDGVEHLSCLCGKSAIGEAGEVVVEVSHVLLVVASPQVLLYFVAVCGVRVLVEMTE